MGLHQATDGDQYRRGRRDHDSVYFCDRTGYWTEFNKMKVLQTVFALAVSVNFIYILFVLFVLPDYRRPSGRLSCSEKSLPASAWSAEWSLIHYSWNMYPAIRWDGKCRHGYHEREISGILVANVSGWWIMGYSQLFCPRPGSRVQVVATQTLDKKGLRDELASSSQFGQSAGSCSLNLSFSYPGTGAKRAAHV